MASTNRRPNLIGHLEQYLGRMAAGYRQNADGRLMRFQIVRFDSPPFRGCSAFTTLGLSRHPLHGQSTDRHLHVELLMMVRDGDHTAMIPGLLESVANEMLDRGLVLPRGGVIGPRGPLWEGTSLEALYATSPVYLPDEFAAYSFEDGEQCHVIWLVPITRNESDFIHSHGGKAFEALLVEADPDLLAPDRTDVEGIH